MSFDRTKALKIQLTDNLGDGEANDKLRVMFANKTAEMAMFRNISGRFIVWLDKKAITPDIFRLKHCFELLPNIMGDTSTPFYTTDGVNVDIANYMDIDYQDMFRPVE